MQSDKCKSTMFQKRSEELKALNDVYLSERQQIWKLVEHCESAGLVDCVRMTVQRLTEREQDVADLKADNETLEKKLEEAEIQRKALLDKIADLEQLTQNWRVDVNAADELSARRQRQIGAQQRELEAKDRDIAHLQRKLATQREYGEQQQEKLNRLCQESLEQQTKIEQLEREIEVLNMRNGAQVIRAGELLTKIEQLEKELAERKQTEERLRNCLTTEISTEASQIKALKEDNEILHYERNLAHETAANRQRQIDALQHKLDNANELAYNRLHNIADRQKKVEKQEERIEELEAEVKSLQQRYEAKLDDAAALLRQLEEALKEGEQLKQRVSVLQEYETHARISTKLIPDQADRITELSEKLSDALEGNENLREMLITRTGQCQDLEQRLEKAEAMKQELIAEGHKLRDQIDTLRSTCREFDRITGVNQILTGDNKQLKEQLLIKESTIQQMLKDHYDLLERTDSERNALQVQRSELERKLRQMERVDALRKQHVRHSDVVPEEFQPQHVYNQVEGWFQMDVVAEAPRRPRFGEVKFIGKSGAIYDPSVDGQ